MQARKEFAALKLRDFGPDDGIDIGALLELEGTDARARYFMGPRAGGTEIIHQKKTILVITPQSPLGSQLLGRRQGERLALEIGGFRRDYRIARVE